MSWFEAFKKAYDEVPSQDNEGYVPDRAGFKCGFSRAWTIQDDNYSSVKKLLDRSQEYLNLLADIDAVLCDEDASIDDIRQYSNEIASVRSLIKQIEKLQ